MEEAAVVAVDMQGYSIADTAQLLGVAEGTVKSRCARARARLAQLLGYLDATGLADPRGDAPDLLAAAVDRAAAEFPLAMADRRRWGVAKFWAMTAAAQTRVNHLWSAGSTYQGADSVLVWLSISEYARW